MTSTLKSAIQQADQNLKLFEILKKELANCSKPLSQEAKKLTGFLHELKKKNEFIQYQNVTQNVKWSQIVFDDSQFADKIKEVRWQIINKINQLHISSIEKFKISEVRRSFSYLFDWIMLKIYREDSQISPEQFFSKIKGDRQFKHKLAYFSLESKAQSDYLAGQLQIAQANNTYNKQLLKSSGNNFNYIDKQEGIDIQEGTKQINIIIQIFEKYIEEYGLKESLNDKKMEHKSLVSQKSSVVTVRNYKHKMNTDLQDQIRKKLEEVENIQKDLKQRKQELQKLIEMMLSKRTQLEKIQMSPNSAQSAKREVAAKSKTGQQNKNELEKQKERQKRMETNRKMEEKQMLEEAKLAKVNRKNSSGQVPRFNPIIHRTHSENPIIKTQYETAKTSMANELSGKRSSNNNSVVIEANMNRSIQINKMRSAQQTKDVQKQQTKDVPLRRKYSASSKTDPATISVDMSKSFKGGAPPECLLF